jgi:transcriptional regulator with XRE-family HTH domain
MPRTTPPTFAARLRDLRTASGLSVAQLAEKAGLTRAGVDHLERGVRRPGWDTVLRLADALGVSVERFR